MPSRSPSMVAGKARVSTPWSRSRCSVSRRASALVFTQTRGPASAAGTGLVVRVVAVHEQAHAVRALLAIAAVRCGIRLSARPSPAGLIPAGACGSHGRGRTPVVIGCCPGVAVPAAIRPPRPQAPGGSGRCRRRSPGGPAALPRSPLPGPAVPRGMPPGIGAGFAPIPPPLRAWPGSWPQPDCPRCQAVGVQPGCGARRWTWHRSKGPGPTAMLRMGGCGASGGKPLAPHLPLRWWA